MGGIEWFISGHFGISPRLELQLRHTLAFPCVEFAVSSYGRFWTTDLEVPVVISQTFVNSPSTQPWRCRWRAVVDVNHERLLSICINGAQSSQSYVYSS